MRPAPFGWMPYPPRFTDVGLVLDEPASGEASRGSQPLLPGH
ncbi:Hypothetical protein AA314_06490 [Archangium gephyra]|uniref:Uncharacterized protein n=1 Tax=Archangium gephyra TaxID=48 RepID=A0AAC8QCI9_9BACT|nr:Hypothetical protein AA314_06490 [Archangium gephyra]